MRLKLVVANWKMHMTCAEASAAVEAFVRLVGSRMGVESVVCPPYPSLLRVRELLRGTSIQVGAQDVFWMPQGAFTGKVSAAMLKDCGATFCIVGHSETRGRFGKLDIPESTVAHFGETDETVNLKIRALLFHSIAPILCVGETSDERAAGQTEAVIRKQIEGALAGIDASELNGFVVAYEPVWAIGTGQTCDAVEANRVSGFIRSVVADLADSEAAASVRVLYGGSVKPANAGELFAQPEIDGGLVGGASLDPSEFSRIVMSA